MLESNAQRKRRDFLICCAAAMAGSGCAGAMGADRSNRSIHPGEQVAIEVNGQALLGMPLIWTDRLALLLCRDGSLLQFDPQEASPPKPNGRFEAAGQAELRSKLMGEFGSTFDVVATTSFLVVKPKGAGASWPDTLESLHRAFQREFIVRNIPLRRSRFPLIAIVTDSRESFYRQVVHSGHSPSPGILGIYSSLTNRVSLYDHGVTAGGVADTIRHEAAHQSAFNVGLHIRLADNPQWFVEGLGAFFEADGISASSGGDRKNTVWRDSFAEFFPTADSLASELIGLVERDTTFKKNTQQGYAASWALTSYLLDRMPAAYSALANACGQLQPLQAYAAAPRMSDFRQAIGFDLGLLATNVHRWVQ